jgi:hypothetical protein
MNDILFPRRADTDRRGEVRGNAAIGGDLPDFHRHSAHDFYSEKLDRVDDVAEEIQEFPSSSEPCADFAAPDGSAHLVRSRLGTV